MAEDVTSLANLSYARRGEPLTDAEQTRLRELTGKSNRSAQQQYELGGLRARARTTQQGRQALNDLTHERLGAGQQRRQQQQKPPTDPYERLASAVRRAFERDRGDLDLDW